MTYKQQLTEAEAAEVEQLIDRCGLATVVGALALICAEKAEHVRTNWQDKELAAAWHQCGLHLLDAETAIGKENLP